MAKKTTGELEMFMEIWEEREHYSEVRGPAGNRLPLVGPGHFLFINQFSHCLPKSIYGKVRLVKENIILMTAEQHDVFTRRQDKVRNLPNWQWVFDKYENMKQRYHQKEWQ